jgi:hypothetical protein
VLLLVGVVGMVLRREQEASQLAAHLEGLMGPAGRELVTRILTATSSVRNFISFYHHAYRAAVWLSRQNFRALVQFW